MTNRTVTLSIEEQVIRNAEDALRQALSSRGNNIRRAQRYLAEAKTVRALCNGFRWV